jgi:hypothetical protein
MPCEPRIAPKKASQNPDDQERHADVGGPCEVGIDRSREQLQQLSDVLPENTLGILILLHRSSTLRRPAKGPPARPRSKLFGTVNFRCPAPSKTGPRNDFRRCPGAPPGCPARTGAHAEPILGMDLDLIGRFRYLRVRVQHVLRTQPCAVDREACLRRGRDHDRPAYPSSPRHRVGASCCPPSGRSMSKMTPWPLLDKRASTGFLQARGRLAWRERAWGPSRFHDNACASSCRTWAANHPILFI